MILRGFVHSEILEKDTGITVVTPHILNKKNIKSRIFFTVSAENSPHGLISQCCRFMRLRAKPYMSCPTPKEVFIPI